jgi:hypothetical protein
VKETVFTMRYELNFYCKLKKMLTLVQISMKRETERGDYFV